MLPTPERPNPTRILLVDDHESVRQGLAMLLNAAGGFAVVGEACDGRDVVALAQDLSPDVVVMDVAMPGVNGLSATRALRAASDVAIVVLSRHADEAYVQELLKAGATAYVLKQSPSSELIAAVRAAAEGRSYLDARLRDRLSAAFLTRHIRPGPATASLSERETVVLRDMAWGYGNSEIATRLGLSVKTVEVHKANGMRKLAARGRTDVVRYALLQGWLRDE